MTHSGIYAICKTLLKQNCHRKNVIAAKFSGEK